VVETSLIPILPATQSANGQTGGGSRAGTYSVTLGGGCLVAFKLRQASTCRAPGNDCRHESIYAAPPFSRPYGDESGAISKAAGCPILSRTLRKGGNHRLGFLFRIQSLKIRDRCSHPCKERKDGAPSVVVASDEKGGRPAAFCALKVGENKSAGSEARFGYEQTWVLLPVLLSSIPQIPDANFLNRNRCICIY
jgi:hypothetical protein